VRLSRQNVLLLVLLVLSGVLAWLRLGGSAPESAAPTGARPQTAPPRAAARPAAGRPPAAGAATAAPSVQLAALKAEREVPAEGGRNPFRFERPAPVATPPPTAPPPQRLPAPVAEPPAMLDAASAAPPQAPARAPAAPITLKFIGLVQRGDGVSLAVLSPGEGKGPLYGREGDIIEGRYRIIRIGSESLEIEYADGRGRQTLKLSGQ
jgi:hypothetical protein